MPDSLSRQLARWAVNLDAADLPPAVVDKMQTSLLHATVVAIIGAETHHGKAAVDLALAEEASAHGASILASGGRATRCGAAFANSKLMHATNQADSYRMLTHPGPCVIPAALASAQLGGATGAQLITAMAAGYEVESRIAGDFIASTQARGFRSSPIYGTLGRRRRYRQVARAHRGPDGHRHRPGLHLHGRNQRGTALRRSRDDVPRAPVHAQRHHGGPAGPRGRSGIGRSPGRTGRLLQRLYGQQPRRTLLRVHRPPAGVLRAGDRRAWEPAGNCCTRCSKCTRRPATTAP